MARKAGIRALRPAREGPADPVIESLSGSDACSSATWRKYPGLRPMSQWCRAGPLL